jgi:hypothetical protein
MNEDDRDPERVAADRARYAASVARLAQINRLQDEERQLMARLESVQAELAKIPARAALNHEQR